MPELLLLRSTYGSKEEAEAAARKLVDRRLAACVHVQAIWSTYRWKGRTEAGQEWSLEARTTLAAQDACWAALLDGHPYDTPLVEVLGPTQVPARYAQWAQRSVRLPD